MRILGRAFALLWLWLSCGCGNGRWRAGATGGRWRAACLGRPFQGQRERVVVADAVHECLLQLLPVELDDAVVDLYAVSGSWEARMLAGGRRAVAAEALALPRIG